MTQLPRRARMAIGLAAMSIGLASLASAQPPLSMVATPRTGRSVGIRIVNAGGAPVRLRNELVVESHVQGAWHAGAGGVLDLATCGAAPRPLCIEIPAGGALSAEAWDGMTCRMCECDRNGRVPAGRYRFVVRTCDGAQSIESTPFEMPAR